MNRELVKFNRQGAMEAARRAENWGRANKSDPFARDVAISHMFNGVCLISDYDVEFRQEERLGYDGTRYTVEVPHNMKRP